MQLEHFFFMSYQLVNGNHCFHLWFVFDHHPIHCQELADLQEKGKKKKMVARRHLISCSENKNILSTILKKILICWLWNAASCTNSKRLIAKINCFPIDINKKVQATMVTICVPLLQPQSHSCVVYYLQWSYCKDVCCGSIQHLVSHPSPHAVAAQDSKNDSQILCAERGREKKIF